MADASAIYAVSEGLRRTLQDHLALVSILPSQIFIESIDLLPDPVPPPRVTIFLYNIRENEFLKNRPHEVLPATPAPGLTALLPPPLVLDLEYMICAWAATTQDEHLLLGDIARVFYDNSELLPISLGTSWRPHEAVQIAHANPSIEDQARIWTTFGFKRFKLSLYYRIRVVPIRSERIYGEAVVSEREADPRTRRSPVPGELPPGVS